MSRAGLYIHVPFCESKCPYCDFYSVNANQNLINKYVNIVCKTLIDYSKKIKLSFDAIYFGGGTPSLIQAVNIKKIIDVVRNNFEFFNNEVTIEINPSQWNKIDFELLKSSGVNRLSIGAQSANSTELKTLGRKHTVEDIEQTINIAKKNDFRNISLDLMLAIPNQTFDSLKKSIKFYASQNVQHISAYLLKIEENTYFYKNKSKLNLKTDSEEADLYLFAVEELNKYGFDQYEISNFSKKGFESKHNLKYWNLDEYLGIGPSAHSFVNGKRFYYEKSLKNFLINPSNCLVNDGLGGTPKEYIMLQLRLNSGLNKLKFKNKFFYDVSERILKKAEKLKALGYVYTDNGSIKLTPKGFLVSNEIISQFLS